ncbi:MAG TPA: transglutaminase family protein, partial [Hyphomicrobiales bacterium]|nr:transglutaminase family protein [Hyphomicrobiales bacterium]
SESCCSQPQVALPFAGIGNEGNRVLRLRLNPCELQLEYSAQVELQPQVSDAGEVGEIAFQELPQEVLPYLNPSRYCESDRLARLALREFSRFAPGHQRVQAICDWVYGQLQYLSGSTDARSSACDVLVQGAGVCRDFAHLAIALCRAICIPARYVSGYALSLEPPDFHGFFEAYLDGGWYLFDATRMASKQGLVRIGSGRDAADVSFASIIGNAMLLGMQVSAIEVDGTVPQGGDEQAVSTAQSLG